VAPPIPAPLFLLLLLQGVLNWVARPSPGMEPPSFEARLYDVLFKGPHPAAQDDWLEDLNEESLTRVSGGLANPQLAAAQPGDK
jgi:glutaminyl-tRNA synthetase